MPRRSMLYPRIHRRAPLPSGLGPALAVAAVVAAELWIAPCALADPADELSNAIVTARAETSCSALHFNPITEQAATVFNRLTDEYLDHTATRVPSGQTAPGEHVDPLPGLRDIGYGGTKAYLLQGTHSDPSLAIRAAVLEGLAGQVFSDCSYTDVGVNMAQNKRTGFTLASVVLGAA